MTAHSGIFENGFLDSLDWYHNGICYLYEDCSSIQEWQEPGSPVAEGISFRKLKKVRRKGRSIILEPVEEFS